MIVTIILFSFAGAIFYAYVKELNRVTRFRRNIHAGDTVKCSVGQNLFTATVRAIPGSDCVVISDLTYDQIHEVSIHSIYPL